MDCSKTTNSGALSSIDSHAVVFDHPYPRFPMPRAAFPVLAALALTLLPAFAQVDTTKLPPAAANYDFDKDIRPLLEQSCVECHSSEKQKGAFRLDTREMLLKGGENGETVKLGKSAESTLIHHVARLDEDAAMPPKKERALTPVQVGML